MSPVSLCLSPVTPSCDNGCAWEADDKRTRRIATVGAGLAMSGIARVVIMMPSFMPHDGMSHVISKAAEQDEGVYLHNVGCRPGRGESGVHESKTRPSETRHYVR